MRKRKLAKLTRAEDAAWEWAWCYHMDDKPDAARADKLAWRDVCREFPRLRKYEGCLP